MGALKFVLLWISVTLLRTALTTKDLGHDDPPGSRRLRILKQGMKLHMGDMLISPNETCKLEFTARGQVALGSASIFWTSGQEELKNSRSMMFLQNGKVVLADGAGKAIIEVFPGAVGNELKIENDCSLKLSNQGSITWASGAAGRDAMYANGFLRSNSFLISKSGECILGFENGDVSIWRRAIKIWSAGVKLATMLQIDPNGQLQLVDQAGNIIWTPGANLVGNRLEFRKDCHLTLVNAQEQVVWVAGYVYNSISRTENLPIKTKLIADNSKCFLMANGGKLYFFSQPSRYRQPIYLWSPELEGSNIFGTHFGVQNGVGVFLGTASQRLNVTNDCKLLILDSTGAILWKLNVAGDSKLKQGEIMRSDEKMISKNGMCSLQLQKNGSFGVYQTPTAMNAERVVWFNDIKQTQAASNVYLSFSKGGILHVASSKLLLWKAKTTGKVLSLENDCNLRMLDGSNVKWKSGQTMQFSNTFDACRCTEPVKMTIGNDTFVRHRGTTTVDTRAHNISMIEVPEGCRVILKRWVGTSSDKEDMSLTAGVYHRLDLDYHEVCGRQSLIRIKDLCTPMVGAVVAANGIGDRDTFFTMSEDKVIVQKQDRKHLALNTMFRIVQSRASSVAFWSLSHKRFLCITQDEATPSLPNPFGTLPAQWDHCEFNILPISPHVVGFIHVKTNRFVSMINGKLSLQPSRRELQEAGVGDALLDAIHQIQKGENVTTIPPSNTTTTAIVSNVTTTVSPIRNGTTSAAISTTAANSTTTAIPTKQPTTSDPTEKPTPAPTLPPTTGEITTWEPTIPSPTRLPTRSAPPTKAPTPPPTLPPTKGATTTSAEPTLLPTTTTTVHPLRLHQSSSRFGFMVFESAPVGHTRMNMLGVIGDYFQEYHDFLTNMTLSLMEVSEAFNKNLVERINEAQKLSIEKSVGSKGDAEAAAKRNKELARRKKVKEDYEKGLKDRKEHWQQQVKSEAEAIEMEKEEEKKRQKRQNERDSSSKASSSYLSMKKRRAEVARRKSKRAKDEARWEALEESWSANRTKREREEARREKLDREYLGLLAREKRQREETFKGAGMMGRATSREESAFFSYINVQRANLKASMKTLTNGVDSFLNIFAKTLGKKPTLFDYFKKTILEVLKPYVAKLKTFYKTFRSKGLDDFLLFFSNYDFSIFEGMISLLSREADTNFRLQRDLMDAFRKPFKANLETAVGARKKNQFEFGGYVQIEISLPVALAYRVLEDHSTEFYQSASNGGLRVAYALTSCIDAALCKKSKQKEETISWQQSATNRKHMSADMRFRFLDKEYVADRTNDNGLSITYPSEATFPDFMDGWRPISSPTNAVGLSFGWKQGFDENPNLSSIGIFLTARSDDSIPMLKIFQRRRLRQTSVSHEDSQTELFADDITTQNIDLMWFFRNSPKQQWFWLLFVGSTFGYMVWSCGFFGKSNAGDHYIAFFDNEPHRDLYYQTKPNCPMDF